jgi:hypothetical protein
MGAAAGAEDPIGAIFDLSDRVAQMAPTMRRMYYYTATVVVLYLFIMLILLFVGLRSSAFLAVLALIALALGGFALTLLREIDRFFTGFTERHRAIRLWQDAEPTPKIPEGPTPVQRLARYLTQSNAKIAEYLAAHPNSFQYRVELPGKGGKYGFDLAMVAPEDWVSRYFGGGDPGFAVLARIGPAAPTIPDLDRYAADVRAVARKLPSRVARVLLLRPQAGALAEGVYDYAVGHPIDIGRSKVAIEIVTEQPDGTYDFIPHVLGVP